MVHYSNKEKYWNRIDEAYGCLFLSISRDLLFHINGLKTSEVWDKLSSLFDKQDDLRIYQLENELISLHLDNFEAMNDFSPNWSIWCSSWSYARLRRRMINSSLPFSQNLVQTIQYLYQHFIMWSFLLQIGRFLLLTPSLNLTLMSITSWSN